MAWKLYTIQLDEDLKERAEAAAGLRYESLAVWTRRAMLNQLEAEAKPS